MSLDPTTILKSALLQIKTYLVSAISDPKAGSRPSSAKFVMTSFPSREIFYPHVIVRQVSGSGNPEAVNDPISFEFSLLIGIDVFSESAQELDEICGEIILDMLNGYDGLITFGLHAMQIPLLFRDNPIAPPGVHRKTAEYSFICYVAQTV